MWPSDTRGYATPATPNALFGRHNRKFSQNNTRGSHPKAFISPQIKTILWFSAMVPTNVVRVSELSLCTLRLSVRVFTPLPDGGEKTQNRGSRKFWKFLKTRSSIYASSFGSGGGGGGEGFYIRLWCGGRGMQSDRHSFPSMLCGDQVLVCTPSWCGNRGGPTHVTDWHRLLAASPAFPSPTPQNPHYRLTELIYMICQLYLDIVWMCIFSYYMNLCYLKFGIECSHKEWHLWL